MTEQQQEKTSDHPMVSAPKSWRFKHRMNDCTQSRAGNVERLGIQSWLYRFTERDPCRAFGKNLLNKRVAGFFSDRPSNTLRCTVDRLLPAYCILYRHHPTYHRSSRIEL
jgi:hypothetical protein